MTLTNTQCTIVEIINNIECGKPLTDKTREMITQWDAGAIGITQQDKEKALRMYEHTVGCTLKA